MKELKLTEVLEKLKKEGISITKRTFEFYQRLGLLPKPKIKQVGKRGRGVYGYYNPLVIKIAKVIYKAKEHGRTLAEIKERVDKMTISRYRDVLKKWGFSTYFLPELLGISKKKSEEANKKVVELIAEGLKQENKKLGLKMSEEDLLKSARYSTRKLSFSDTEFEKRILEELHWDMPSTIIELRALEYISNKVEDIIYGLGIADLEIIREKEALDNEIVKDGFSKLVKKITKRIMKLKILEAKVNARIAEIAEREYKGKTKERWKTYQEIFEKSFRE